LCKDSGLRKVVFEMRVGTLYRRDSAAYNEGLYLMNDPKAGQTFNQVVQP